MKLHKAMTACLVAKMKAKKVTTAAKVATASPAGGEAHAATDGPLVGLKVRVVDEEIVQIFGQPAEIAKQGEDFWLVTAQGDCRTYKVREDQCEFPHLLAIPAPKKGLALNLYEKEFLAQEFPEICNDADEGLQMTDRLTGDHLSLQHWVSVRDIGPTAGARWVQPIVVYQWTNAALEPGPEAADLREKAGQILLRLFKRSGLLGIPVYSRHTDAAAHWSLLVFRKHADYVAVRYYDSASVENEFNRSIADLILTFVQEQTPDVGAWPLALPVRANSRSRQINGIDCGIFNMFFWEGEMRRFSGEGWSSPFPSTSHKGPIFKMRERLVALVKQMKKIPAQQAAAKAKPKGKAKAKAAAASGSADPVAVDLEEGLASAAQVTDQQLKESDLAKLAQKTFNEGSVRFYGCSRCRFYRSGCISYMCNPHKFDKHYADHPEAYEADTKNLKVDALRSITNKELVGGACQVAGLKIHVYMYG